MPVKIIVKEDQLKRAIIIVSSAMKLMEGGRAMFVRLASNHQDAIRGRRGCKLRVMNKIRLCVRS